MTEIPFRRGRRREEAQISSYILWIGQQSEPAHADVHHFSDALAVFVV